MDDKTATESHERPADIRLSILHVIMEWQADGASNVYE